MRRILILSGRSGSGKSAALHALEDLGFYCIDNLPLSLLADVVQRIESEHQIEELALGIDVRNPDAKLHNFDQVLALLTHVGEVEVIYLNARDDVLLARFASTRRKHPLSGRYEVLGQALAAETRILSPIARHATLTLDTSNINAHQLQKILQLKLGKEHGMVVIIQSFGFKRGLPMDADFVFDVRHLPNPHWEKGLRHQSGLDKDVIAFLAQAPAMQSMYSDLLELLSKWLPQYAESNRHSITIAIGCTGGQHRSVYLVDRLATTLQAKWHTQTIHRELSYWS